MRTKIHYDPCEPPHLYTNTQSLDRAAKRLKLSERHCSARHYVDLGPKGKNAADRVRLAREAVCSIAGSQDGGDALLRATVRHNNDTTAAAVELFEAAGAGKTKAERAVKAVLLQPYRGLSFPAVRRLGFNVGPDLWSAAKKWNVGEGLPDGRTTSGKRPQHGSAAHISLAWLGLSFPAAGRTTGRRKTRSPAFAKCALAPVPRL